MQPAAASYTVIQGGFADGSNNATVSLGGSGAWVQGPLLRLPAGVTVDSGSVVVEGHSTEANTSWVEDSEEDFADYTKAENVTVAGGSISMQTVASWIELNASNNFGNATFTNCTVVGGKVRVITPPGRCDFVTETLLQPAGGWGSFMVDAETPPGTHISGLAWDPDGRAVSYALYYGAPMGISMGGSPTEFPQLRIRVTLRATNVDNASITRVTLGTRVGDTSFGQIANGVGWTTSPASPGTSANGSLTNQANPRSYARWGAGPVVEPQPSSFYAAHVVSPKVIQVGSAHWAYFGGDACTGCESHVGRAVSSDLENWSVASEPVLNATAGEWDSLSVTDPFVMADPGGSGFVMFYTGGNASACCSIGRATSPDGVTWTKDGLNPVLSPSGAGWDSAFVGEVAGVRVVGGNWSLWFSGNGSVKQYGVANSTDGRQWTKFAGNPVLRVGTGSAVDALGISAGTLIVDPLSTLLLFYSCTSTANTSICYAGSTNGVTWSKGGLVFYPEAGWDSGGVYGPAPYYRNGKLSFLYVGKSSDATSSLGVADSRWSLAVCIGTLDFWNFAPARYDRVLHDASLPPGAGLIFRARTADTANGYGAYEDFSASSAVTTLAAARYLQYYALLYADPHGVPGTLSGVWFEYELGYARGRYESDSRDFGGQVVSVNMTITLRATDQWAQGFVSADDGASWEPVLSGVPYAIQQANGSRFRYALMPTTWRLPGAIVDGVSIDLTVRTFPAGVAVRAGESRAPFFNRSGPLQGTFTVTLPAAELNGLIAAAAALPSPPAFVDVPLFFASATAGWLEVREARLTLRRPHDLAAEFSPDAATRLETDENTTLQFFVSATPQTGSPPVAFAWFYDGVKAGLWGDTALVRKWFDFDSAGDHTVAVVVSNGDTTVVGNWDVRVRNVNRPPTLIAGEAPPASQSHAASVAMSVVGADPDGDVLVYAWLLDGVALRDTGDAVTLSGLGAGAHAATATASDGESSASVQFSFTTTDGPPKITVATPSESSLHSAPTGDVVFSAEAQDPDGDLVTLSWYLDGVPLAVGPELRLAGRDHAGASHIVRVVARSGALTDERAWALTVGALSPPPGDEPPAEPPVEPAVEPPIHVPPRVVPPEPIVEPVSMPGSLAVVLLLVAAIAVAALALSRRRRGPE